MGELPADVVEEAERLTRLARDAVDPAEADAHRERRDEILTEHEFAARIRAEDTRSVLVLYPDAWLADGSIAVERIEDIDRAVEIPLDGPGEPEDWDAVDEHNRALAGTVGDEHGDVHGANAVAFADFMSNHYARPMESATAAEIEEFLSEYFLRNAWPSSEQKAVVDRSVRLVFDVADERVPTFER